MTTSTTRRRLVSRGRRPHCSVACSARRVQHGRRAGDAADGGRRRRAARGRRRRERPAPGRRRRPARRRRRRDGHETARPSPSSTTGAHPHRRADRARRRRRPGGARGRGSSPTRRRARVAASRPSTDRTGAAAPWPSWCSSAARAASTACWTSSAGSAHGLSRPSRPRTSPTQVADVDARVAASRPRRPGAGDPVPGRPIGDVVTVEGELSQRQPSSSRCRPSSGAGRTRPRWRPSSLHRRRRDARRPHPRTTEPASSAG